MDSDLIKTKDSALPLLTEKLGKGIFREFRQPELHPLLRVLIDGRKLGDGGIGVYIDNLISGLIETGEAEVTVIAPVEKAAKYEWRSAVWVLDESAEPYSLEEMFMLPRRIDFSRFDVFHAPHYTAPFGVPIPQVVTIHDLIHIRHPEKFFYPFVAGHLIKSVVRRASRVIAVSQSTFDDVRRLAPGAGKKLNFVPNALDPFYLSDANPAEYLPAKFDIRGNYILSVLSTLKPHKGVVDLLEAFKNIKSVGLEKILGCPSDRRTKKRLNDLKLVLVGKGTVDLVHLESLLNEAGNVKGVHILGCVSKTDLLNLYKGALALVVPSLAEGFCLPVLEARAAGTPVVARPVPAVLELTGPGDVICRGNSVAALEAAIVRSFELYISCESGRKTVEGNSSLGARYDRIKLARDVLAVYREAVASGRKNERG